MKKIIIILSSIVIVLGGLLGAIYYIYSTEINTGTIYNGITIDGYDIGGMTKEQALEFIKEQKDTDDVGKAFNLFYNDINYNIELKTLGHSYDYEGAIEEAYSIGRDGNLISRYKTIKELQKNKKLLYLEPEYNRDLVLELVDKIEKDINQDSTDATFDFNNGDFIVTEEKTGFKLDKSELINLLVDNVYELEDINLPIEVTEPKITKELLSRINGVIGEFSTSFKGSAYGRVQNIKLSAKRLSNLLILPGDEISYNETVGPINSDTGFMEAPVILNGELTPGMGGGVCQTSTTLYNALLLSDLTIVERHPHSIAASYVPRGTDGAVARGYLDLKFRNDFDYPIYTYSKIIGNNIYFYIYGDTTAKDYTIKIEPELIETIPYEVQEKLDPNAEPGSRTMIQEGRTGYKVRTFKSIIKDGKVVDRYQITFDYYRERDYIYKVGPELPKNVPAEPVDASVDEPVSIESFDENIEVIDLGQ
ncbi:VanW family protein [Tissierella sp. Yu-01]|uniref:VanW family protein n=1 Tax=Tissierella sp. Yu-01 TaxID=3035694 RepID=UPI00240E8F99|nr:VanW family protein [Tissierella sp. Yu-01]WFA10221.1 VanW family protein [Tissierella sp. Yu-01]